MEKKNGVFNTQTYTSRELTEEIGAYIDIHTTHPNLVGLGRITIVGWYTLV